MIIDERIKKIICIKFREKLEKISSKSVVFNVVSYDMCSIEGLFKINFYPDDYKEGDEWTGFENIDRLEFRDYLKDELGMLKGKDEYVEEQISRMIIQVDVRDFVRDFKINEVIK